MFWFVLALLSALCLGFYDVLRKHALQSNAVPPVLLFSTLTSSLMLLPLLVASHKGLITPDSWAYIAPIDMRMHLLLVAKAAIVLASWIFVYYGMKNLPLSIVAPIRATAPIWTLIGALIIFAERPNVTQWIGLLVTFVFFFLFSVAGKREGISFRANKWIWSVIVGTLIGAGSALYDKYIVSGECIPRMSILCYYSFYQFLMTVPILFIIWWPERKKHPFNWIWSIPAIGFIIIAADFFYFGALDNPDAMISLVSPIRRSNSIVSFVLAALVFHEHNMLRKGLCLLGILAGIGIIIFGSL